MNWSTKRMRSRLVRRDHDVRRKSAELVGSNPSQYVKRIQRGVTKRYNTIEPQDGRGVKILVHLLNLHFHTTSIIVTVALSATKVAVLHYSNTEVIHQGCHHIRESVPSCHQHTCANNRVPCAHLQLNGPTWLFGGTLRANLSHLGGVGVP